MRLISKRLLLRNPLPSLVKAIYSTLDDHHAHMVCWNNYSKWLLMLANQFFYFFRRFQVFSLDSFSDMWWHLWMQFYRFEWGIKKKNYILELDYCNDECLKLGVYDFHQIQSFCFNLTAWNEKKKWTNKYTN